MSARVHSLAACAAALALLGLAPAGASALPIWQAAGPDDAGAVDFHAIATFSADATHSVVVAVGQDKSVDTPGPVVYRRVDGEWERQELPAMASTACLNGLAVTATAAWAIGNTTSCTSGAPVVMRFPEGGTELAKADTEKKWAALDVSTLTTPLSSVALVGNAGYLGDAQGNVRPITDGEVSTIDPPVSYSPNDAAHSTAVNGLALTQPDEGYVAGDNSLPAGGRVYDLEQTTASPSPFRPDSNGAVPLEDVDVAGQTPLAIEANAYWSPDANNLWTRQRPADRFTDAGTHLRGVDVAGADSDITSAIAGSTDAGGAAWLRNGPNGSAWVQSTGGWTKYTGLGSALEDVAVVNANDVWAAGAEGNVRHFTEPPLPPKQDDSGGGGDTGGGSTGGGTTDTGGGGAPSSDQTPHTVVVEQPAPKSDPPQSKPTPTAPSQQTKPTGRLMRDVRVRVRRGLIIITFRLTAPARVGAKASTAGRLVGLARVRLLGRGKRSIVLRYRGKRPPAQLQLFVRPAAKAATTNRTTK